jgi:hypothetical protein
LIWQPIPGYHGLYEASDKGLIRRVPRSAAHTETHRILKPWTSTTGYHSVTLYTEGQSRKHRVHRLIASTFLPEPTEGQEVCHNDGNKLNNAADNLRWGTRSDNVRDAVKHGTHANQFTGTTACSNGHSYTEANTLHTAEGRRCRTCRRNRVRAWRARQKEATTA